MVYGINLPRNARLCFAGSVEDYRTAAAGSHQSTRASYGSCASQEEVSSPKADAKSAKRAFFPLPKE